MPRSGGGFLAGLLRSTRVAGRPEEYFWAGDVPRWRRSWGTPSDDAYVADALRAGTTPNGIFGARVMWPYLDDVVASAAASSGASGSRQDVLASAFPDLRYLLLTRRDRVAQAVSWALAIQTGVWYVGDERDRKGEPRFDRALIAELESAIARGEEGWESFFAEARVEPFRIAYEDLVAEPERTTSAVLAFLDVRASGAPIRVRTQRQSGSTNREWVSRYRSERRSRFDRAPSSVRIAATRSDRSLIPRPADGPTARRTPVARSRSERS